MGKITSVIGKATKFTIAVYAIKEIAPILAAHTTPGSAPNELLRTFGDAAGLAWDVEKGVWHRVGAPSLEKLRQLAPQVDDYLQTQDASLTGTGPDAFVPDKDKQDPIKDILETKLLKPEGDLPANFQREISKSLNDVPLDVLNKFKTELNDSEKLELPKTIEASDKEAVRAYRIAQSAKNAVSIISDPEERKEALQNLEDAIEGMSQSPQAAKIPEYGLSTWMAKGAIGALIEKPDTDIGEFFKTNRKGISDQYSVWAENNPNGTNLDQAIASTQQGTSWFEDADTKSKAWYDIGVKLEQDLKNGPPGDRKHYYVGHNGIGYDILPGENGTFEVTRGGWVNGQFVGKDGATGVALRYDQMFDLNPSVKKESFMAQMKGASDPTASIDGYLDINGKQYARDHKHDLPLREYDDAIANQGAGTSARSQVAAGVDRALQLGQPWERGNKDTVPTAQINLSGGHFINFFREGNDQYMMMMDGQYVALDSKTMKPIPVDTKYIKSMLASYAGAPSEMQAQQVLRDAAFNPPGYIAATHLNSVQFTPGENVAGVNLYDKSGTGIYDPSGIPGGFDADPTMRRLQVTNVGYDIKKKQASGFSLAPSSSHPNGARFTLKPNGDGYKATLEDLHGGNAINKDMTQGEVDNLLKAYQAPNSSEHGNANAGANAIYSAFGQGGSPAAEPSSTSQMMSDAGRKNYNGALKAAPVQEQQVAANTGSSNSRSGFAKPAPTGGPSPANVYGA